MNIVKIYKSNPDTDYIAVDLIGSKANNSLSFCADLPKNAVVDRVKIKGSFTHNGYEYNDCFLEDIRVITNITLHRNLADEVHNPDRMQRIVATVNFPDDADVPKELFKKINMGKIADFEVVYHEEGILIGE